MRNAELARVPWTAVFGNDRPVEIEIGPGRGEVLFAAATTTPTTNFFALEHRLGAAAALARRAAALALHNVRVLGADARVVIARLVPDASVTTVHIYFPDPWPKTRHHRRRLITPDLARHLLRTLVPGGSVHLATDLPHLLATCSRSLIGAGLVRLDDALAPEGRPVTVYERRYARTGGTHYACFVCPGRPSAMQGRGSGSSGWG